MSKMFLMKFRSYKIKESKGPSNQKEILSCCKDCVQEGGQLYHFTLRMKGKVTKGIAFWNMILDTKRSIFWEQTVVTVSYLFHHYSLLQNGKDLITKCDSYIIKILDIQLPYIFQVQSQSTQTIANILYIYICISMY